MKNTKPLAALALTCLSLAFSAACIGADASLSHNNPGATSGQSGFVTVKGRHFQIDGKPYYYAGANLWYGMYLGAPDGDRARLTKELDQLASQGVLNLRVLAISESSELKRAERPPVARATTMMP